MKAGNLKVHNASVLEDLKHIQSRTFQPDNQRVVIEGVIIDGECTVIEINDKKLIP